MLTLKVDPTGTFTLSGIPGAILSALIRIINSLGLVAIAEPDPASAAAPAATPAPTAWTHVDDALPADGARVVMMRYSGHRHRRPVTDVGRYTAGYFCTSRDLNFRPTHWMLLPAAPPDDRRT